MMTPTKHAHTPQFRIRHAAWLLLMLAGMPVIPSSAATFYWDSDGTAAGNSTDGTGLGGSGTWDLVSPLWWDGVSTDTVWPDSAADTAVFAGTAGTVVLAGGINAGSLLFQSNGYLLSGGTLTLGGSATIDVSGLGSARIDSTIAGSSGLIKTGNGTLNLGTSNTYSGTTTINAGIVEVYKDQSLGTGGGDIVLDGGTLRALGNNFYSTRDITVGDGGGTLDVTRSASTFGSMRLGGTISGSATLTKTGFGELRLDGDSSGFTGAFVVDSGVVQLRPEIDRGQVNNVPVFNASSYTVRSGGDLQLRYDSLGSTPAYSIINEAAPLHLEGGRLYFASNNGAGNGLWQQNFSSLNLDRGTSRIYINRTSSSADTVLYFGNLLRSPDATISFDWTTSTGTLGSAGHNPRILFGSLPEPVNDGILGGWALVNLVNFANYDPEFGVRVADYTSTDITTAGATDNVDLDLAGTTTTIGNTTLNALKLTVTANNSTIEQLDGTTLTIDTGGLLTLGNYTKYIQPESGGNATITANGGALYVHNAQSNLYLNSVIVDGDMPTALVKTQAGSLVLYSTANNTYSGGTYINGAGTVYTGFNSNQTYFGSGPVFVTRGILILRRMGATSSTQGFSAFEGGSIYLDSSAVAFDTPGDRFTIDGNSSIGGVSATGGGLNSLTYVAGAVSAGGEVHLQPGATILHGNNSAAMGVGIRTIQNLPNDMQFYFGDAATQNDNSGVTIGLGTPWKGIGTDRNTRAWDLGTITVNGFDFELHGMLAPNQNGEGQSAYTLQLGNNTSGVTNGNGPVIIGSAPGALRAHVTGGIVRLEDDLSVFGDTANGSPLTFLVEPGGTLEVSQANAMGSGTGIASIEVLDGGTLQQFYSTTVSTANTARSLAAADGFNGAVTVRSRGRFLAQDLNGLTGTGTLTFEERSIIQISNATGWTGSQVLPSNGLISGQNLAIVKIYADNFGTAAEPTLTTYFDGTGIYEWGASANAANPTNTGTPILSLDGGLVINDAYDRSLEATSRGLIELKPGGAGGTFAASTGHYFNILEDVELHGLTLTIGYADVVDGDPGLGDLRLAKVTSDSAGGMLHVIDGAQLRIGATNAIDDNISITLEAGAWLDVDNSDTILQLIGNGATSRVLGDNTLTVVQTGDYDFNASLGDSASLTQAGGGILTLAQDAEGTGTLTATSGTIRIGTGYTLNPVTGGVIDLNGQTVDAASVLGDSTGTVNLNGGVLQFANTSTVTIDSSEAVINGPGTLRTVGTGSVRFNGDPTRINNISTIDILNGEFRVDGIAGTPDSHIISASVINLGDGMVTTGGTGFRVFPRLYLVNTESTQTATLNMNGGWLISDLGSLVTVGTGQEIWSGDINITGAAATNLIDVNDVSTSNRTQPEEHVISGTLSGTGGFSKVNVGALILTANNSISGDIYVQRAGPGTQSVNSQGGLVLTGPNGALSAANALVLSRDGSLYLDNSTNVLDQSTDGTGRLGDNTDLQLRANARLRLIGNSSTSVSETLGALLQETGSGKVNFDLDDSTPQLTTLSFASYTRQAGAITQFQVIDNLPGALGTTARLIFADGGASAVQYGSGTGNGTTTRSIVLGAFGGVNNIADQFMTFDSASPNQLRPLDFNTEHLLSSTLPVKGLVDGDYTVLFGVDQNFMLNYNVDRAGDPDGDVNWYGDNPNRITVNVAMNSLRFGTNTPTSTVNSNNTNELGSVLVLNADVTLYLGDSSGATNGIGIDTNGSGMILFGRDISGTSPGSNQYIAGGVLDFGTREAVLVNESGNSALIRSTIVGSGGLTKVGVQTIYFDNSNAYSGVTTIAEGILDIRDQHGLGNSHLVVIEGAGQLYLELGTNVLDSASGGAPPDLFVGINDASRTILYSNNANNTWGGDIIIDNVDNTGNWVFSSYIGTNALYTLNINGDIYSNELANPISTDTSLNDARLLATNGINSAGGVINLNGQFHDNANGAIATPVTSDNENQLLRFFIRGSDQAVVNARQQWDAAGLIFVENGILRYEGEGNFWTPQAAANMNAANGQSGMRIGGNSNNWNAAVILTKPGQVLNIDRIDIGGDGTNDYNQFGNDMLAGTNTSGTVTFGNGTERIVYNGSNATNNFVRDLTVYQAGGGTMELNFRLDDTDGDSHTSFTKIGRGVVNFNGQNDVNGAGQNGDVEQLNMSGGLLRLTNYGNATGRRFDTGAMITFAGGGIEMDGASSIQNETANYTGTAVGTLSNFPTAQTLIAPGGTDVIVTSKEGRTTTMNIGSLTLATNRQSGGTLNFVENGGGGTSVITFLGSGGGSIQADDTAYAWATYGDSYTYNAAAATYTLNALDFAMTTGGSGDIAQFAGATRQNEDNVASWTAAMDVSENGAGFNGGSAASPVNTIHFDFDGAGVIDATNGLEVTSGGIMVSSGVLTGAKSILNGTLMAGANADLIVHQYGDVAMTISSVIADNAGSSAGNALVKTGSGELILTGANTYTGPTFLNGGTLAISRDVNLGAAPASVVADSIHINGGILMLDGDVGAIEDVNDVSVSAGGSGYAASDEITITNGNGGTAKFNVDSVDGSGVITGLSLVSSDPDWNENEVSGTFASTGGTGSGASLTLDALPVKRFELNGNRGITLGGNGGELNVVDGTVLTYGGVIASEANVIVNYSANPAVGRIDKTGAGTLVLTNTNNTYNGLTEIKAGTLVWAPTFTASTTATPFGSNSAFLDGTILRSGATLVLAPSTPATGSNFNAILQEWFTFEGGSTLDLAPVNTAADPHDINYYFRGILQFDSLGHAGTPDGVQTASTLAGATVINVGSQGSTNLNDAGGYITGDGGITKIGAGTLYFRESNPEWTGQLIISEGSVNLYSAGNPTGVGTMPIILGHNLAAEQAGEAVTGTTTVQLLFRDEGGYRDVSNISQNIIVRSDAGAGNQIKRIGAVYLAHADVVNYNGTITLQDDVELYYQDDVRDSNSTSASNTRNDTRSVGAPTNAETVFINFNGSFIGNSNISTNVPQGGSGNVANGSITDPFDDFVINAIFGLNGDNRSWTGDLLITNNSNANGGDDVDRIAILRLGNEFALNDNLVKFASQGHLQLAGINKTFTQNFLFVGATGLAPTAKIENAAFTDVTVTFDSGTQSGVNFQDIGVGMADGLTFGGTLYNQGLLNVVKTGAGETVFGASTGGGDTFDTFSNYHGTTLVQQGTLYAGSNNSFSPYSRFIVADGAKLSPFWDNAGTGFNVTIGSLSGGAGATVNIENSIFNLGGDDTDDADFAGIITTTDAFGGPGAGAGGFFKIGSGSQRLSGANTFVTPNIGVLQGTLIGGSNTAFGDAFNVINLAGIPFVSINPVDGRVELLLDGTADAVVNPVVMNNFDGNDEGITVIGTRATSGTYGFATGGTVSLYQDVATNVFVEADGTSVFRFGDMIMDLGFGSLPLIKVGAGTVELRVANTYGSGGSWAAGPGIDGGTIVRHGTLSVFDGGALSTTIVELGDTRRELGTDAYLATTRSLITAAAGGSFNESSNGAGGAGNGAFLNVSTLVDGVTITTADIGKRILVMSEGNNPERNGVYEIVSLDPTGTHMNLVRAADFDETSEMLYGTSIRVTHGTTHAGGRFFVATTDVNTVNGDGTDPVYWLADDASPDVGLVAGASDLYLGTDIDINDTNGSGATIIGGTFTSGTTEFAGAITLQHLTLPGVDNVRELTLISSSNDSGGGVLITGPISTADPGDTLNIRKEGPGTVTLDNPATTYTGKTTIAEGTLAIAGDTDISTTNWIEIAAAGTLDFSASNAGDFTFNGPVSGAGTVATGSGTFIIGTSGSPGFLSPGMSSDPASVATAGDAIGTFTVNGNLELAGDATGVTRLTLQMGATNGADYNDSANFLLHLGTGDFDTWITTQGDAYDTQTGGNHDRVVVTGSFTMNSGGIISFTNDNGADYQPVFGDVFNLLDWSSVNPNGFSTGGMGRGDGLVGDLGLPDLSLPDLLYDTSLFFSHGIVVVVPEPGRAALVLLGLIALVTRRRRR